MNPITIDEGRAQLTQIADARRSRSLTGRQTLAQFEQARQDFIRAQSETNRSVQSRIETVDEHGNITTEILPGVPNGLRSGSQLISTNVRSLRGRIRAIRSAEFQLDKIITSIRRNQWDEVPRDPPAFLESLWSSIPPAGNDELEVVAAPSSEGATGTDKPSDEESSD